MQHPLRTNKAFQVAYTSHQEHQHRRLLSFENVDELVVSLGRLQQQQERGEHELPIRENFASPPPLPGTFTEGFMRHRGLPLRPPFENIQPLPLRLAPAPDTQKLRASPSKKLLLKGEGGGGGRGGGVARLAPLDTSSHTAAEQQDGLFKRRKSSSTRRGLCSQSGCSQLPRAQSGGKVNHVQALRSVLRRNQTMSVIADRPSPGLVSTKSEPDESGNQ